MGTRLGRNGLGSRSMDWRSGSGKRRVNDIRTAMAKPHFRWLLAGLGCAKMAMMGTECPGKDRGPCKWTTDPRSLESELAAAKGIMAHRSERVLNGEGRADPDRAGCSREVVYVCTCSREEKGGA
jgi:hypothetical protein